MRYLAREMREICETEAQKYGCVIASWKPDKDGGQARVTFERSGRRSVAYVPLATRTDGTGSKRLAQIKVQQALVQIGAVTLSPRNATRATIENHQQIINRVFGAPNPGTMGEALRDAIRKAGDELPASPAYEPGPSDDFSPNHVALPPGLEPQPELQPPVPNTGPVESAPATQALHKPFQGKNRKEALEAMAAVRARAAEDLRGIVERGEAFNVEAFSKAHNVASMTVYSWIRNLWSDWLEASRTGYKGAYVLRLKVPTPSEPKEAPMTTSTYTNGTINPDVNGASAITITKPAAEPTVPGEVASRIFRPSRMQFADMVMMLVENGRKGDNGQYTYNDGFDDARVARMIDERCPADQVKALRREKFGLLPGEVRRSRVSEEYVSELEARIEKLEGIIAKWKPIVDELA